MSDSKDSVCAPGCGDDGKEKDENVSVDDINIQMMEGLILKWLCEADDVTAYTSKAVRGKMEQHLNLPSKALKKHDGFNQATQNVCICVSYDTLSVCLYLIVV